MTRALAACVTACLVLLGARSSAAHDPITTKITFAREIRAILSARCTACHSARGSAPMPLTTYDQVRPWARAITEQVLARRMPTWHAARGFGAFKNDPTLTPLEIAMLVAWVDGGLPRGAERAEAASGARGAGAGGAHGAKGAVIRVAALAAEGRGRVAARWVSGWTFEPGDPLITTATFTLRDKTIVGTWSAGDGPLTLPAGSAIRVSSPLGVRLTRRQSADFERPSTARASVLWLMTRPTAPARRVWTEQVSCNAERTGRAAQLLAIRPSLPDHGEARIWIERIGAPPVIVGWFRDFEAASPRTYWLARGEDFSGDARLSSSERCDALVTLATAR